MFHFRCALSGTTSSSSLNLFSQFLLKLDFFSGFSDLGSTVLERTALVLHPSSLLLNSSLNFSPHSLSLVGRDKSVFIVLVVLSLEFLLSGYRHQYGNLVA